MKQIYNAFQCKANICQLFFKGVILVQNLVYMKHFTIRFEIIDPQQSDYNSLKTILLTLNFTKTIKSHDGAAYILPQGEYRISGQYEKEDVLKLAISAIERITSSYRILVTESAGTVWTKLKKA